MKMQETMKLVELVGTFKRNPKLFKKTGCGSSKDAYILATDLENSPVIKVPKGEFNYCKRETLLFEEAQNIGADTLLARSIFLNGYEVQENIAPFTQTNFCDDEVKVIEWNNMMTQRHFKTIQYEMTVDLQYRLMSTYGEEILHKFDDFITLHDINDIRDENWGYNGSGDIVMFDYSGFAD